MHNTIFWQNILHWIFQWKSGIVNGSWILHLTCFNLDLNYSTFFINFNHISCYDLFFTVHCNSNWQKCSPVELLAIRLEAPLSRIYVSWSCLERSKTQSSVAGGVAFVPFSCSAVFPPLYSGLRRMRMDYQGYKAQLLPIHRYHLLLPSTCVLCNVKCTVLSVQCAVWNV